MPLNTRDLWLVLKAQDQTNRALNTFSRNVRNAGNQVRMAQLEAAQAASMGAIAQGKLSNELKRAEIGQLQARKAVLAHNYVQAQLGANVGMTTQQIEAEARSIDGKVRTLRTDIAATSSVIANEKVKLQQTKDSIAQLDAYNRSIQDNEKSLSHLAGRIQSVGQTATAAGFAFSAAGALTLIGLKKTIDVAVEYERQVRLTSTQVSNFGGNLEQLAEIGRRVAREIAVPFKDIQPALYDIFSSIDVNITEAEQLLTQFAKAAVAGQTDIQSVSRGTIGIMNAFGLGAQDLNRILDIQFKLVQKGIGTYDEWTDRFGKVSPSAQRAGQSIEQMAAALAAATRFGVPAAQAATSVARVFDAFSNPAAIAKLKQMGVAVVDAKGNFRDFNVVMREFRDALMKIPGGEDKKIAAILDVFKGAGGTIEARKFLNTLLLSADGLNTLDGILGEVSNSSGTMMNAYNTMANSTAAKSQLLANQWDLLKESVGKALIPVFAQVVTALNGLMKKFDELSPHTKQIIAYVLLGAGVFLALIGPILLVVGAVAAFAAAIAVAGTAIAVTLAVMAGAITAFVAFGATFVVLYKKSESFRELLGSVSNTIKELWQTAAGFAKDVGDAWDKYLGPPLEKLWNVIEERVLPAMKEWWDFVNSRIMPAVREAARIIGDILGKAFEFIGMVIERVVIPGIIAITKWWEEHKKTLMPLISAFAQVVKWVLIIGAVLVGVLVAALVGPVIAAILAVVAMVAGWIAAITYLIEILQWLWGWIVKIATAIWDFLVAVFSAIGDFFVRVWEGIVGVFQNGGEAISTLWNALWAIVVNALRTFNGIVMGIWSGLWNWLLGIANGIANAIRSAWDAVTGATSSAWNAVKTTIMEKFNAAKDAVSSGINAIKNFFSGAGTWLIDAGKNIIQGLISGVESMINTLKNKISSIAGMVRNAWPFSPAKWGPLSGRGDLKFAGANIVDRLAEGMTNRSRVLERATAALASQVGYTTTDNAYTGAYGATEPKTVNQNITVNTQEIDPRRHSAELGWELARVM